MLRTLQFDCWGPASIPGQGTKKKFKTTYRVSLHGIVYVSVVHIGKIV